jgi:hypothetical protein
MFHQRDAQDPAALRALIVAAYREMKARLRTSS